MMQRGKEVQMMPRGLMRSAGAVLVMIALPVALLSGCSVPRDPRYGPDAPRNGYGQPVDPAYGTPLPGTPYCCGGRS